MGKSRARPTVSLDAGPARAQLPPQLPLVSTPPQPSTPSTRVLLCAAGPGPGATAEATRPASDPADPRRDITLVCVNGLQVPNTWRGVSGDQETGAGEQSAPPPPPLHSPSPSKSLFLQMIRAADNSPCPTPPTGGWRVGSVMVGEGGGGDAQATQSTSNSTHVWRVVAAPVCVMHVVLVGTPEAKREHALELGEWERVSE